MRKMKNRVFNITHCTRLSLYLNNIGGGSAMREMKNKVFNITHRTRLSLYLK